MSYIELYNDNILDVVNIGKTIEEFDESEGDYIKVEIFGPTSNIPLGIFFLSQLTLASI